MLKVGIVGFGFMGRMHYRCWNELDNVTIAAICDACPDAVRAAGNAGGNIAGAEGPVDLENIAVYSDLATMLAEQALDAISITVPTYLHADCSVAALQSGVHVLCEKPMALDLEQCARMMAATEHSGKLLQIGHCIRFWPEYAKAKEIVESGQYGRVVAATFQRLAATALNKTDSWFTNEAQSGGMALDLHIHDSDFVQYLFGLPRAVSSFAAPGPGQGPCHIVTRYRYDDERLVIAEGGWAMMPSFGFQMRFHIVLEEATIAYDGKSEPTLRVCPAQGEAFTPELDAGDGYSRQIAHFARRIRGESEESVINLQEAQDAVRLVNAEKESARKGGEVSLTT